MDERLADLRSRLHGPFIRLPNGQVDCTYDHPLYGKLPFTAGSTNTNETGRLIYDIVSAIAARNR